MTTWSMVYGGETVATGINAEDKQQLQNDITQAIRDGHHWFELRKCRPYEAPLDLLISAGIPISFEGKRDMSSVTPVVELR